MRMENYKWELKFVFLKIPEKNKNGKIKFRSILYLEFLREKINLNLIFKKVLYKLFLYLN